MQTVTTFLILVFMMAVCLSFHPVKAQQQDSFLTKIVGKDTFIIEEPTVQGARPGSYKTPTFPGDLNNFLKETLKQQLDENGSLLTGKVTVLFSG